MKNATVRRYVALAATVSLGIVATYAARERASTAQYARDNERFCQGILRQERAILKPRFAQLDGEGNLDAIVQANGRAYVCLATPSGYQALETIPDTSLKRRVWDVAQSAVLR